MQKRFLYAFPGLSSWRAELCCTLTSDACWLGKFEHSFLEATQRTRSARANTFARLPLPFFVAQPMEEP